ALEGGEMAPDLLDTRDQARRVLHDDLTPTSFRHLLLAGKRRLRARSHEATGGATLLRGVPLRFQGRSHFHDQPDDAVWAGGGGVAAALAPTIREVFNPLRCR